jgi:hypothetical protein
MRKTFLLSKGLRAVLMAGIIAWMLPASGQVQSLGLYPAAAASADADRLSDAEELTLGTNPSLADTDGDFITDSDELLITGTNPLLADSDMDGLTDYEEWVVLIPRLWDVNKNGMLDIEPLQNTPPGGYSPLNGGDIWWITAHLTDFDGEGLSDRDEIIFGNLTRYHYNRAYVDWPNGEGETYDYESWARPNHWEPTDYDRDGLNAAEEVLLQTDPNDPDTDGDGLQDGLDSIFGDPLLVDTDSDGVSDHDELMYYSYAYPYIEFFTEEDLAVAIQTALGSSALGFILDWDGDGMSNVWEIAHGLNPVNTLDAYDDPDGDFLFNLEEYQARTDPNAALSTVSQSVTIQVTDPVTQLPQTRAVLNDYEAVTGLPLPAGLVRENGPLSIHDYDDDWDGDGYGNRDELLGVHVRDPRYNDVLDTDGDGLFDTWEVLAGLDKDDADEDADSLSDGADDFDNDGLTNLGEQAANTNPLLADTDGDSLPDGWEVTKGINPLNADQDGDNLTDDADNFDIDLLTNAQELAAGTHPRYADTDWDGLRDDWELANQLNPLSSAGIHGGSGDADGDGFSNAAEQTAGSSPQSAGSTPPATYTFKSWTANGESYSDTPGKYEVWVDSYTMPLEEEEFEYDDEDENEPVATANTAADWLESTMAARDYANGSIIPATSYNPDVMPAPERRESEGGNYPVSAQADFRWVGHEFYARYRRVRLEAVQPVAASETRPYLVYAETESANSFQKVGVVTFTLPVGQTKASVTLSSALSTHGLSVASDGKTLKIEPPAPVLTAHGYQKRAVYLLPFPAVRIQPDANVAGVVGDMVKSFDTSSVVRHFVTPKKTTDVSQDYVELIADGVTATEFDEWYVWEGGEAGSATNKRKVKRDVASKTEIKIKTKQRGLVAAQMTVWVVWVTINATAVVPIHTDVDVGPVNAKRTTTAVGWRFEGMIYPSAVTGNALDKPDMSAPPTGAPVPETSIGAHVLDGFGYSNPGAKWDMSRQWRWRTNAPSLSGTELGIVSTVPVFNEFPNTGRFHQTTPNQGMNKYPTNSLEGNDDSGGAAQNPYATLPLGMLLDTDFIQSHIASTAGSVGGVMESVKHFREFARLEINGKWYRISDYTLLRMHVKLRKKSESAAGQDLNADGDMNDTVWVNDGSLSDLTNQGW